MGLARPFCREGNHLFIRERIPAPLPHKVKRYWAVVDAALGEGPHPYGTLEAEPRDHGGFVLHPGISRFRLNKRWPAARFAGLADRLVDRFGLPIVLTAGPGEREQAEEVARRMRAGCEIVEPADLGELKSVLAGARLVVSADTGPAHVAAALGVATLTLVGPTDPREIAPYGPRSEFLTSGARCSPCSLRSCPDPVCMTELDEECVFGRVLELLEEGP
jgi:ADP-heptose:LPS heptosyltransferase